MSYLVFYRRIVKFSLVFFVGMIFLSETRGEVLCSPQTVSQISDKNKSFECATKLQTVLASINGSTIFILKYVLEDYQELFMLAATIGIENELGMFKMLLQKIENLKSKYKIKVSECGDVSFTENLETKEGEYRTLYYWRDHEMLKALISGKKSEIYERLTLMYSLVKLMALTKAAMPLSSSDVSVTRSEYARKMIPATEEVFAQNNIIRESLNHNYSELFRQIVENYVSLGVSITPFAIEYSKLADAGLKISKGLALYYANKESEHKYAAKNIDKGILRTMSETEKIFTLKGGPCIKKDTGELSQVCTESRSNYLQVDTSEFETVKSFFTDNPFLSIVVSRIKKIIAETNDMLAGDFTLDHQDSSSEVEREKIRQETMFLEELCLSKVQSLNAKLSAQPSRPPLVTFNESYYINLYGSSEVLAILSKHDGPLKGVSTISIEHQQCKIGADGSALLIMSPDDAGKGAVANLTEEKGVLAVESVVNTSNRTVSSTATGVVKETGQSEKYKKLSILLEAKKLCSNNPKVPNGYRLNCFEACGVYPEKCICRQHRKKAKIICYTLDQWSDLVNVHNLDLNAWYF